MGLEFGMPRPLTVVEPARDPPDITGAIGVAVDVAVAVLVGVRVGVPVTGGVLVGVLVDDGVAVGVFVPTGVFVIVLVGVRVGVFVGALVGAPVGVFVLVFVTVAVGVEVPDGVDVGLLVGVPVAVFVGVALGVNVGVEPTVMLPPLGVQVTFPTVFSRTHPGADIGGEQPFGSNCTALEPFVSPVKVMVARVTFEPLNGTVHAIAMHTFPSVTKFDVGEQAALTLVTPNTLPSYVRPKV